MHANNPIHPALFLEIVLRFDAEGGWIEFGFAWDSEAWPVLVAIDVVLGEVVVVMLEDCCWGW